MPRVNVAVVGDARSAVKAFRTTRSEAAMLDRQLNQSRRSVDRFGRGVVAGSGVLGGLGRSVAFASSTFLGGAGLVYAFRKVTHEARNAQAIQVRTAQAVRRAGLEWKAYRKEILATVQVQSRKSSFDDEELLDTLGKLVTRTRDVRKAQDLLSLSTDVARGRNMALEASSRLVLKASIGQGGALRRLGINIKEGASAETILAALRKRYAGQAVAYSRTSEGAQERFNKTLRDSEEIIGRALLPSIDKLVRAGTEWLEQQNRSGNLQKVVNQNFRDAQEILRGVADGLKLIKSATEPVVDAVGGVGNAVTALTVLWVGMRAKALFGFGALATASSLTRTKVIADAAAMELALDAATRPRVVPIEIVGGGIPGLPGKIGKYGTGKLPKQPSPRPSAATKGGIGGFLSRAGKYLGPAAAGAATAYVSTGGLLVGGTIAAIIMSAGGGTHREDRSGKYPRVYSAVAAAVNGNASPQQLAALQTLGQYSLENAPDKVMRLAEQQLRRYERYAKMVGVGHPPRGGKPKPGVTPTGGTTTGGAPRRTLGDVRIDVARARAAGDEGAQVKYLNEEKAMLQRAVASLDKRGELTKKEKGQLENLLGLIDSVNGELASIAAGHTKDIKKKNNAAAKAHKEAADAAKKAAEKIRDGWTTARQQAGQAFGDLFGGPILGGSSGLGDFFRQFGSMGAKLDPKLILQDIRQQNAQSAALIKNIQTVAKRGAPVGLMNQLREMGPEGAAFAASLANAPKDIFDAIVAAFKERQSQLKQATVFIQARNVTVTSGGASSGPPVGRPGPGIHRAGGGMVPGSGIGDTVPAMLTPGEMVLNRMQQGGLARALGMQGASSQGLFGAITQMATGGVAGNGGGFGGGSRLDGRPWFSRRGPRDWGLSINGPDPRVPMRRDIGGFLDSWTGHGLSPAQNKGGLRWWTQNYSKIAKGYAGGGLVGNWTSWANSAPGSISSLKKLGGYLGHQSKEFVRSFIPSPSGIKAMGMFARDLGLGWLTPAAWMPGRGSPERERSKAMSNAMLQGWLGMLRDPIGNAGLLASMFVPLPGGGKVSAPTKALANFQSRLVREGAAYDVPLQKANMRIPRERADRGAPAFNRRAAMVSAKQIWMMATAGGSRKGVLPPGVKSPADIVNLMHDLHNSAIAGKVGKHWYEKSGRDILSYTHGNRGEAHKLARLAALYSPRVSVEESIRRAAMAWQEFKDTGGKSVPTKGVFDYQPKQAMKILSGEMTSLNGRKVNNFYLDLISGFDRRHATKMRGPNASTIDVWMQKAFGYMPSKDKKTGKWSINAPNDPQYDFMESVVAKLAADLGWNPNQTQAAIWTTTKARFEKRSPGAASANIGDYFRRQGTQINYEAAWGTLAGKIRSQLGEDALHRYSAEKFALLRGSRGQSTILEQLGLLGKPGGAQQGVWGVDVTPGFHDLVLAPRFAENRKRFRMLPRFERDVREAAAAIGYVLRQQGVGTMAEFPMLTAAGTANANVKAGANAVWLARKFSDKELAGVSKKLGTRVLMLPRKGGWVLKPASNSQKAKSIMAGLGTKLEGMNLQPANAHSGYVDASQYGALLDRAEKKHPGTWSLVKGLRAQSEAIDRKWMEAIAGKMLHAAGGALVPGRGNRDTVPAMLTPGELVLNRRQQVGVSQALGLGRMSGKKLFSEIQGFAGGGVLTGRQRSPQGYLGGSSSGMQPHATFEQHNTITVPPQFADTEWAIERGLARATWRLKKGI